MSNHVKRHDSNVYKVGCSPLAFVVDSGTQCVQFRVEISHTYSCFNVILIKDPLLYETSQRFWFEDTPHLICTLRSDLKGTLKIYPVKSTQIFSGCSPDFFLIISMTPNFFQGARLKKKADFTG